MGHFRNITLLVLLGILLSMTACEKETIRTENEPNFDNPFEGINGGDFPDPVNIDPESFLGIYNNILSVKCGSNDGACHDGSFEPDFRTLFSAYNTIVYHSPIKNIIASINGLDTTWVYDHRVSPGDPDGSWLYYRITTSDEDLGRMPLYDQPLPESQIDNVRQWILAGAPDPFGNLPDQPSAEPQFFGLLAYENDVNGVRLDTSRTNIFEPMVFPQNTSVNLWFGAIDYDATGEIVFPILPMGYSKIKIGDHLYNFDGIPEENMPVEFFPHMGPSTLFNLGIDLPYYYNYTIDTEDFEIGTIYYIRIYLQGSQHDSPTEIPETGSAIYWKTYMSFVVE